ncbi:hypothetical protein WDZ92_01020 [Nostoc sp. NIES-2111]
MAISLVGWSSGTTSAVLPAHAVDDAIVIFAFRDGSATPPTAAAGFTEINSGGANLCSARLYYKRATTAAETSGTWTSATTVLAVVLRGVDWSAPIGGQALSGGASNVISYPGLTMSRTDGSSLILAFGGHRSANVAIDTVPSGMTLIGSASDATDEAAVFRLAGATSFTTRTASVGGTSSGWRSATVEILAAPEPAAGYVLTASGATLSLAGGSAALRVSRLLAASGASLSLSGGEATLRRSYILAAQGAALGLAGASAALRISRRLVGQGGFLAFAPQAAVLRRGFRMVGEGGSLALSTADAVLRVGRRLTGAGGQLSLQGATASLRRGFVLSAAGAALALSTGSARLLRGRRLTAEPAALALSTAPAVLRVARRLTGLGSTVAIEGGSARLLVGRRLIAEARSLVFAGGVATLIYVPLRRLPRLTARAPEVPRFRARAPLQSPVLARASVVRFRAQAPGVLRLVARAPS